MISFYNTGIEAMTAGVLSALVAQATKFISYFIEYRKINFKVLTTTGGMPSSHSAGVVALSASVGLIEGFSSIPFAVAMGYTIVVMYDAAGLRRAAGKTAATLNRIVEDFSKHVHTDPYENLKELLGHTPLEVFGGAILGICISCLLHFVVLA